MSDITTVSSWEAPSGEYRCKRIETGFEFTSSKARFTIDCGHFLDGALYSVTPSRFGGLTFQYVAENPT